MSVRGGFQRLGAFGPHFAKTCSFVLPTSDFDLSFFDWEPSLYFKLKVENNISSRKWINSQLLFTHFKQLANLNPNEPPKLFNNFINPLYYCIGIAVVIGTDFFISYLA